MDEPEFQNPRTCERWTGDKCIRQSMWQPTLRRAGVRYRKPYQAHVRLNDADGRKIGDWVTRDWSLTAKRYSRWIAPDISDAEAKAVEKWETQPELKS